MKLEFHSGKLKKYLSILLILVLFTVVSGSKLHVKAAKNGLLGIDVSKYNGVIDWEIIKEQGIEYAMIKTGDGKDTGTPETDIDSQFEANYQGARDAGLEVGVYHVCSTRTVEEAIMEAEYCLSILDGRELDYPVAYDIEMHGTFTTGKDNVTAMAVAFCEVIEEAGYTPMIYSTSNYLNTYFDYDQIKDYQIWVAHYNVEEPKINFPYQMWQFTAEGEVDGVGNHKGHSDLNYAYTSIPARELKLSVSKATLGKGETYQLKAELVPLSTTDTLTYKSSDKAVCTVSKAGKITAKKVGTATITVTSTSGLKAKCKVTVKKAPTKVTVSTSAKKLTAGTEYQLKWTLPANSASNKLTLSSSNTKVASVNQKGVVKAIKKGTSTITIKTFNGKTAKVKITVS